jgi:predicted RNase H-like HicB family nuclease
MTHYFGLLDGEAGGYGIAFPDLPGCAAMGDTPDTAWRNAIAALADWIAEAGGPEVSPIPSALEALRFNAEVREALLEGASFITVPLLIESGRCVRANISLDQGILAAIDAAAEDRGLTRSSFLASAAMEKIRAGRTG